MKKLFTFALACFALMGVQQVHAQNAYAAANLSVGDSIELDDVWYIVGKNLVTNGDFDEDPSEHSNYIVGWTNAAYEQMTTSTFNWYSSGGYDDGAYITGTGNGSSTSTYSIGQRWSIDSDSKYYFSFWISGLTADNQYVPVVSITNCESTAGGQNEYASAAEANGGTATMLLGANGDSGETPIGYANWNEDGSWANTSITFDSEECTYLQFNARWLVEADYYGFDGFGLYKLYDPETTTKYELLEIVASGLMEDGYDLLGDLYDVNALVFAEAFEIYIDDGYYDAENDEEAMAAYVDQMEAYIAEAELLISLIPTLDELIEEAEGDLELGYDGASELQSAIDEANDFAENGYGDYETTLAAYNTLEEAINTYLFSQPATADNPADYTFLLSTPYYLSDNDLIEISYQDDNAGIESISYVNEADYSSGSAPDDSSSDGWYTGTTGGDQRLNYFSGRVCWNAWRTGDFTVAIYQDLEDLPNGVYTISAEMLTQSTCITDQHLVANGSSSTVSATLTSDDSDNDAWEWLTTEKVLVLNGTLTIGAEGSQLYDEDGDVTNPSGYSDNRGGWFLVTNWRLLYYGEASDEEIAEYYASVVAEATALLDSVYYAADKAALQAAIDEYGAVTSDYGSAIEALNEAIEEAEASYEKYVAVSEGSLLDVQTYISDGTYSTSQAAIAQTLVDIVLALEAADDATYTAMDDYTTIIRYYRDSYLPVLAEAEALSISDETAQAAMAATIAEQVAELTAITELPTTDELDEYIAELNNAIAVCQGQDLIASGETDLTTLLVNATVDASSTSGEPDGWTVNYNQSRCVYYGQDYMDDGSDYYFDSYNSTAGAMYMTAYQTVTVPNGVYEVQAMMRASGTQGEEGVYLLGVDGTIVEDTYTDADDEEVDTIYFEGTPVLAAAHIQATDSFYIDSSLGKGVSYGYFSDSYGPIWAEAYDAVDSGEYTSDQETIAAANGNIGYGWFYVTLQVTVTGRQLTVGVTNDSTLTAGYSDTDGVACVPATGTWYSADNFTLTLISSDDDYNIASGIESVATETEQTTIVGIYALDGRRISSLSEAPAGIYIVRQADKTIKVLKR